MPLNGIDYHITVAKVMFKHDWKNALEWLKSKGYKLEKSAYYERIKKLDEDVGLINQEFLDAERERLGPLYPMYYECDFYNSSSTWYKPEYFQYGDYEENM
ncbi:MAG: hypothetical protein OEM77_06815 [Nitrosopumilus sp.]|nr:hypothetical protein [Nitrosopumilus sp.]MDH3737261.1 hypothetical protein [Nitrosopumilus sp.]MDH3822938.1 hypothetical protein [Nitrosopumilus sp.]MDH3833386.1 hypothetical protein [Nitrosopumilus sp.]